jgi:hypothetical protein
MLPLEQKLKLSQMQQMQNSIYGSKFGPIGPNEYCQMSVASSGKPHTLVNWDPVGPQWRYRRTSIEGPVLLSRLRNLLISFLNSGFPAMLCRCSPCRALWTSKPVRGLFPALYGTQSAQRGRRSG